jgi:hypothetical protein
MLMSEFPVVSVHVPKELRPLVAGHEEVMASGETVEDLLHAVGHTYPDFAARVFSSDGTLAEGLRVSLGANSQTTPLAALVEQEEVLSIFATGKAACAIQSEPRSAYATREDVALISIGD